MTQEQYYKQKLEEANKLLKAVLIQVRDPAEEYYIDFFLEQKITHHLNQFEDHGE